MRKGTRAKKARSRSRAGNWEISPNPTTVIRVTGRTKGSKIMIHGVSGDSYGKVTQTAGTRIQALLGGVGGHYTHVSQFRYTSQGTAHVITLMIGASRGKAAAALAAAGTALVCDTALTDGAGNLPANLDNVAVRLNNSKWHLSTISAWNAGTKTLTLNTAIPTGLSVLKGAPIVLYGVAGDAIHAAKQFAPTVSTTENFPNQAGIDISLCRAGAPGEPILFDSDNGTAAGTLVSASVLYARR